METRQSLRDALLGAPKHFKSTKVTVQGKVVEIRQPSVGVRNEIFAKSKDKRGDLDLSVFPIWSVIKCCYVPDTNERIFIDEDFDAFLDQPTDSFVNELSNEVMSVMSQAGDDSKKKHDT